MVWNWGPLVLWACAIFWMSSQPVVPHPGRRIGIADDLTDYGGHILSFGLLAVLTWRVVRTRPGFLRQVPLAAMPWLAGLLAAVYALTDEVHQSMVPGRTASIRDWLADVLGVLVACTLIAWYQARKMRNELAPVR